MPKCVQFLVLRHGQLQTLSHDVDEFPREEHPFTEIREPNLCFVTLRDNARLVRRYILNPVFVRFEDLPEYGRQRRAPYGGMTGVSPARPIVQVAGLSVWTNVDGLKDVLLFNRTSEAGPASLPIQERSRRIRD